MPFSTTISIGRFQRLRSRRTAENLARDGHGAILSLVRRNAGRRCRGVDGETFPGPLR